MVIITDRKAVRIKSFNVLLNLKIDFYYAGRIRNKQMNVEL